MKLVNHFLVKITRRFVRVVKNQLGRNPYRSIKKTVTEMEMSVKSFRNILKGDLRLKLYRI